MNPPNIGSSGVTITVVIPTLNEERNLESIAASMPACVDEIVVVDGNSTDNTVSQARKLWPEAVIIQQTRRGKGNALACGFEKATGDIIVMIDADCSTDPQEIPSFVQPLLDGADYAKGSRFTEGGGSADITRIRALGNHGLNFTVNTLFRSSFSDLCYGYNAFWRHCLDAFDLPETSAEQPQWGDGFEIETLINTRVTQTGLAIVEIPSFEEERKFGTSNLNAVTDGLRVLRTILTERFRSAPERPVRTESHPYAQNQVNSASEVAA